VSVAVDPTTVQAGDFTVNGTPANSFVLSNGNATITFHFNNTPVTNQGVQTMHIPAGAFNSASNGLPVLEFQWHIPLRRHVVAGNFDQPTGWRHLHRASDCHA
jgi:hypothetical protein